MSIFQTANRAATFLILGAIVAGRAKQLADVQEDPIRYLLDHREIVYLGLFIILLRIKTTFDDHRHFAEVHQDQNVSRYIGFVLAILWWVFWGLAGYRLPITSRASELMAISILISTSWIVVHLIEILVDKNRRNKEVVTSLMREKWVLINIGYLLCLVGYIGWFRPLVMPGGRNALMIMLALLLFDMLTSRSFRGINSVESKS